MSKREREDDDDLELDLDLELEFEESVGEPRPMSQPTGAAGEVGAAGPDDEESLELAGDLLAETGEELLDALSTEEGGDEAADDLLVELEAAADELEASAEADADDAELLGAAVAAVAAAQAAPGGAVSEPVMTTAAGARAASDAPAGEADGEVEGQWVWQFAAPAPPPPFSAVFFAGRAHKELYWFFASGLMVVLGCLLPWGPSLAWVVEQGESTLGYTSPPAGYELPGGAICLALALWLVGASAFGIYTGRQKILPVFLMLDPAWLSWSRTLEAWGEVSAGDLGFKESVVRLFEVAGTGVLLTLVGSTIVAAQLLFVILKIMKKQPAAEGRARKGGDKGAADKPAKEKPAKERRKKGGDAEPAVAAAGDGDEGGGKARGKRRGR